MSSILSLYMSWYVAGLVLLPCAAAPFYLSEATSHEDREAFKLVLKSYVVGFAVAMFCAYVVPLRHCPSNPFLSHMVERRKKMHEQFKIAGLEVDSQYGKSMV